MRGRSREPQYRSRIALSLSSGRPKAGPGGFIRATKNYRFPYFAPVALAAATGRVMASAMAAPSSLAKHA
jgi:hypothetical protein